MSPFLKTSLGIVALIVALGSSGREARAQQATYVGTFALTNGSSIKVLTNPNNSTSNSNVQQTAPWAAIPAQEWAFIRLPNGFYAIQNVQSQLYLEVPADFGGSLQVDQYQWTATTNQMWYLYPLGNQFYAIVNVANGSMLADPYSAITSGNPVLTTSWTDNLNQWWYFYFLRY